MTLGDLFMFQVFFIHKGDQLIFHSGFLRTNLRNSPFVANNSIYKPMHRLSNTYSYTVFTFPGCYITRVTCACYIPCCVRLFMTPRDVVARLLCPWGFSRQEYWSGLPCAPLGDLPKPGIEPTSFMSPVLADVFFTTRATWEVHV